MSTSSNYDFKELFGTKNLLAQNDTEISISELQKKDLDVIFLYFSAHWCPPCRGFTPELAKAYSKMKSDMSIEAEVVFVSGDQDAESFKEYFSEMPWLALSYDQRSINQALNQKYECNGIPYLVAIDAKTGELLTTQGRSLVSAHGGGFAKAAKEVKKNIQLAESKIKDLSILGNNVTDKDGKAITNLKCKDVIVVAFGNPTNRGWQEFIKPKLLEAYESLVKNNVEVVYISEDSKESKDAPWAFVPSGTNSSLFSAVCGDVSAPNLTVLVKEKGTSEFSLAVKDASRSFYDYGADACPWNKEGIARGEAKKEERRKEMAKSMANFDLLKDVDITDSNGKKVDIETLRKTDVVGLYFSAHWCGPCRGFTPKLAELYKDCKAKNKNFEIVFVSSDRDAAAHAEYFKEMPWTSLDFKQRSLKAKLSEIYGVSGIPTLVLLKGDGTEITRSGRSIVNAGADYFPWDEASMLRGKEAVKQKEKNEIDAARKAGDVVMKRLTGAPPACKLNRKGNSVYEMYCDAFETFGTEKKQTQGKWYYEVNLVSVSQGIAQIGFANDGFAPSSGNNGVGDDDKSWGFDGNRMVKWNNGSSKYGESWKNDDVLGCAIDLDGKTSDGKYVEFYLNGKSMGKAFTNIKADSVYAAATGQGAQYKFELNFGTKTKYPVPSGFKTWGE